MFRKMVLIALIGAFLEGNGAFAQSISFGNLDEVIESQKLEDVSNRYIATIVTYSPEKAALLGLGSINALDARNRERNNSFIEALKGVQDGLRQVNPKLLSVDRKTDYELLEKAIENNIWTLKQDKINTDPLYYTSAFDNLYALSLEKQTYSRQQVQNLVNKLLSIEQLKTEAKRNLTSVSPYLAKLATEKTYYAYIALDSYVESVAQTVRDEDLQKALYQAQAKAKRNIKELFDFFKVLAQQNSGVDFRLGEVAYKDLLAHQYEVNVDFNKLAKEAETVVATRQDQLTNALLPFSQEVTNDEVVLIEEAYGQAKIEAQKATTEQPKKEKKKKNKKNKEVKELKNAQDFYGVQNKLALEAYNSDVLNAINSVSSQWNKELVANGLIPSNTVFVAAKELPQYYSYLNSTLLHPVYRKQTVDLFVKIPSGNKQAKSIELAKNYNEPMLKLLVASQIFPGKYYEMMEKNQQSSIRKWYSIPTIENAWSIYAEYLAKKAGFILTDTELLYLTWQDYLRALATLVDIKLHTRQISYEEAMNYLTQTHGLTQEDAEKMVKEIVLEPGKRVSEYIGMNILSSLHDKYQRKYAKKFTEKEFNGDLLRIGSIPQARLEVEMAHYYKKK